MMFISAIKYGGFKACLHHMHEMIQLIILRRIPYIKWRSASKMLGSIEAKFRSEGNMNFQQSI